MVAKYRVCPHSELGVYDTAHGVVSGLRLLVGIGDLATWFLVIARIQRDSRCGRNIRYHITSARAHARRSPIFLLGDVRRGPVGIHAVSRRGRGE